MGMTIEQAIKHGKEQLEIFGGEHKEFIETSIEVMRKYQEIRKIYMTHHYTDEEVIEKIKEVIKYG
jgi:uncharacterized Fe-S radical SAM superfamily protein PflX